MDEYISREDVLDIVSQYCADDDGSCSKADVDLREMLDEIEALPAADVQPIIHAHWIKLPRALNSNENPCKCSSCGHVLSFMNGYPKSKYCDECGAKMDIIYEDDKVRAIKITGWDNDVRDWQPLPEPPKDGDTNE